MPISSRKLIKKLTDAGWFEVRQSGSHKHFHHAEKEGTVTVPHPKKTLKLGTIKSIERQSGEDLL